MSLPELLGIHEAATYLGRKHQAVRRLVQKGILPALLLGQAYMFEKDELDKVKAQHYPEGMTHGDIGKVYGKGRTSVHHHFKRLGVKPMGYDKARGNGAVYDEKTVAKFAHALGWNANPHKSPTGEP